MLERPILRGEMNFPLCLAPMVGLTHVGFRLLLKSYMPPGARTVWPTEMLNSRRLPHEVFARVPECSRHPSETDLVPQILGNEESEIARSVKRLDEEWGASGIDINMGCPVRKALSHNYGVALMGDAQYARDVVAMTVRHTRLPVSVKLRAADAGTDVLFRFAEGLVEAGAEWLTLHPRRAEQKRRGSADWSMIHDLRHVVPVAVIGNGDIQQADDVFRMLDETGCDAVMAGRALTARPWLLWQVGERLGWPEPAGREGERAPQTREEEGQEFGRAVLRLIAILTELPWGEDLLIRKLRFFLKNACPWLEFGHALEAKMSVVKSLAEAQQVIAIFFSQTQMMSRRTDLRY